MGDVIRLDELASSAFGPNLCALGFHDWCPIPETNLVECQREGCTAEKENR